MKQICFIISFAILSLISVATYATDHFTEYFTAGPADYYTGLFTYSSGLEWDVANVEAESAAYSYGGWGSAVRFYPNLTSYVISPSVNSVGSVTFYYREVNAVGGGEFSVQKSVDGGAFTEVTSQIFSGTTYQEITVDINDNSDNIRIKVVANVNTFLIIDDMTITAMSSDPELQVSPTALSGFNYIVGSGPSTEQSYNLSGSNLTGFPDNITVTAPSSFEVSLSAGSGYAASINVPYTSATLASTPIYVRLKSGLSVGTYNSEIITNTGGGATTVNVTCSGTVEDVPPPSLITTPSSLSGFNYIVGSGPSSSQSYNISGENFTDFPANLTIYATVNYEISLDDITYTTELNVPYTTSSLPTTTIYVRLKAGLTVGAYNSEQITNTVGCYGIEYISCSGDVTDVPPPTLTASPTSLSGFDYIEGSGPSNEQSYSLSGSNLTGYPDNIVVTAPTNYEVSLSSGSGFTGSLNVAYTSETLSATTIYVRLKSGLPVGTYNGEVITNAGGGATNVDVTNNGTVSPVVSTPTAWINEFHYDNESTDANEMVEIVIVNPGSYTLSDFRVDLYNGNGGATYDNELLSDFTVGASSGTATIYTSTSLSGMQNGSPDGIALSYQGTLIQFLSYEGSFTAVDGVASGTTSTDIGVAESGTTPLGHSLQLTGDGCAYSDFTWQAPAANTQGSVNNGQTLCSLASPTLTASPTTLSGFTYIEGSGPSTEQSFDISGTDLNGTNVIISPTTNYEISLSAGSGYQSTDLTLSSFDGSSTTIYVRLISGLVAGDYNGETISITGGGADEITVTCSGTVDELLTPVLTANPTSLTGFNYTEGSGPSTEQSFEISGTDLNGTNVIISPTTNYEISLSAGSGYQSTDLTLSSFDGSSTTIYVRLISGLVAGDYNGETISITGGGASEIFVTCSGTVDELLTPVLTANPTSLTGFNYTEGSGPSTEQSFEISGTDLNGTNVIISPTTNYEISLSAGSGYQSTDLTLPSFDGSSTTIYVRLIAGLVAGDYNSETISITGGGADAVTVTCNGSVDELPVPSLTITSGSLDPFYYVEGFGPSTEQTVSFYGTDMDGSDFTVTPSINLEISLSSGTGFTSDPIILSSYDGTATDIYVRLEAGLIPGEYNTESIVFTGGGISETDIFITGTVDENVFVNNISTSSRTEIYPNPSSDIIFIELDGWKSNKVSCEIFDMLGKQIFQSHINLFNGHTEERINLSNYDSGIYLIRLSDGQTIENLRIEKQ